VIRAYLSEQHFEDVENSGSMVALPTDVSRSGQNTKRAFETVFQAMVSVLERSSNQNGKPRRSTALSAPVQNDGGPHVIRGANNVDFSMVKGSLD
jgi:TetR/AcrR family transcriptional repressor of nem operon